MQKEGSTRVNHVHFVKKRGIRLQTFRLARASSRLSCEERSLRGTAFKCAFQFFFEMGVQLVLCRMGSLLLVLSGSCVSNVEGMKDGNTRLRKSNGFT